MCPGRCSFTSRIQANVGTEQRAIHSQLARQASWCEHETPSRSSDVLRLTTTAHYFPTAEGGFRFTCSFTYHRACALLMLHTYGVIALVDRRRRRIKTHASLMRSSVASVKQVSLQGLPTNTIPKACCFSICSSTQVVPLYARCGSGSCTSHLLMMRRLAGCWRGGMDRT